MESLICLRHGLRVCRLSLFYGGAQRRAETKGESRTRLHKKSTIEQAKSMSMSSTHLHPNLVVSPSKALQGLFTKMRDVNTSSADFVKYSKRAMRLVAEDSLAEFPCSPVTIATPCATQVVGLQAPDPESICAVSIVRSGDALLEAVRDVEPAVTVGKILIQRDEACAEKTAQLYYSKLPPGIAEMHVLLCDPMLATGGSAVAALQVLCDNAGVDPSKIVFANMISCPEGLQCLATKYPQIKIVTACIDEGLNDDKFIVPGLGDYGDRFFNT